MSAFDELLAVARDRSLPPVADWQPQRTGEIDIRIASNGDWYHEGTLVKRFAIARLFATILRVDDGAHYLVTPVEKLRIEVEDAPFIATDFETDGEDEQRRIVFATNVGDAVLADAAHPIVVEGPVDAPRPYVLVRDGLRARIARAPFYRLVDLAEEAAGEVAVWSARTRFVLGPAEAE